MQRLIILDLDCLSDSMRAKLITEHRIIVTMGHDGPNLAVKMLPGTPPEELAGAPSLARIAQAFSRPW